MGSTGKWSHRRREIVTLREHQGVFGKGSLQIVNIINWSQLKESGAFNGLIYYLWGIFINISMCWQKGFEGGIEPQLKKLVRPR